MINNFTLGLLNRTGTFMVTKANLVLPFVFCALSSFGQPGVNPVGQAPANHVVIGAFSSRENAERFMGQARQSNPDAAFNINPDRNLFYVYTLKTENRVKAFAEARRLRKESKYWDTWVYYGALGGKSPVAAGPSKAKPSPFGGPASEAAAGMPEGQAPAKKPEAAVEAEVKAYSMADEPTGLDLNKMISGSQTQQQKEYYQGIKEVKSSVAKLDKETKVIVFKDDTEGRQALRALGYDIPDDKPVTGFFDSQNNILAVNATEAQADGPFHEGLKPVVKFLRKRDPEKFMAFAEKAKGIKHPLRGVTYGELNATGEEALANMMSDVARGYFGNSPDLNNGATAIMGEILNTLGVGQADLALSAEHLRATATNLAIAVREASGFDAEGNRKFIFDLYNTANLEKVKGEVALVSGEGRKIASYPGNETVKVLRTDASGNIILACEVMGFRKLLLKLNYDNPFLTDGVVRGENEEAIVPFGLVRLQKGDIAVMYNVYFFKDAAIVRPESRYELNNLLAMMNENGKYKIMIHGHTNGNAAGKIITMGSSRDFFSLTDTKEGRGSAKKLSEERAKVIREYLIDHGIAGDRMGIKAWGGKRPLYDKNHSLAQANVRVEIEIIEN